MNVNYSINLMFIGIDFVILIYAFVSCFSPMRTKSKSILKTCEELEQFHENEYEIRYEDIDNVCQGNASIKEAWNNFKKTITRYKEDSGKHKLSSIVSAEDFFRISDVAKGINLSYWQNFGGIFTGIGIFGTFMGLVIGLWGVDLSSSDVTILREGIGNLLNGISVAFVTSLVGIFFTLIYGFLHHFYISDLQRSVGMLVLQIEKMYPRATTEQWLSDSLWENKEQTRTLKNLSQDMAEQLGEILDAQFSTGLDELCEKLDSQMRPVFDKLYDAISTLSEGGISAIAGAVNEKTGTELQAFSNVLSEIQATMQESIRTSREASERANQVLESTISRFSKGLVEGAELAAKQQQDVASSVAEQMQNVANLLSQTSENAMNNFKDASVESKMQLKESMEMTRHTVAEMLTNMKDMAKQQSTIMEESARKSKERTDKTIELLQNTLAMHSDSVEESYSRVKEAANAMRILLEQTNVSISAMKDSAEPVEAATAALRKTLEETDKRNIQIQALLLEQSKTLTENGLRTEENITALIKAIEDSENHSMQAWNRYRENFENVSGELTNATDLITRKLGEYNDMMNDGMSKQLENFDKSVANTTGYLNATVEELRDIAEELLKKK